MNEKNANMTPETQEEVDHVYLTDGEMIQIDNPSKLPDSSKINRIEEPYVMHHAQTHGEHFTAFEQMANICPCKITADRAVTFLIKRLFVE